MGNLGKMKRRVKGSLTIEAVFIMVIILFGMGTCCQEGIKGYKKVAQSAQVKRETQIEPVAILRKSRGLKEVWEEVKNGNQIQKKSE
ncbi:MAG: hypothetical protein RRZ33_07765 [Lachnospiraceae bacterium]